MKKFLPAALVLLVSCHVIESAIVPTVLERINLPQLGETAHNVLSSGSSAVSSAYGRMKNHYTNLRNVGQNYPLLNLPRGSGIGPVFDRGHTALFGEGLSDVLPYPVPPKGMISDAASGLSAGAASAAALSNLAGL